MDSIDQDCLGMILVKVNKPLMLSLVCWKWRQNTVVTEHRFLAALKTITNCLKTR